MSSLGPNLSKLEIGKLLVEFRSYDDYSEPPVTITPKVTNLFYLSAAKAMKGLEGVYASLRILRVEEIFNDPGLVNTRRLWDIIPKCQNLEEVHGEFQMPRRGNVHLLL